MSCYFIANIFLREKQKGKEYEEYIRLVEPIVEHFEGVYLVRTDLVTALNEEFQPDRLIVIRFPTRGNLETCFHSEEYRKIMSKRVDYVDSRALIVEGADYENQ